MSQVYLYRLDGFAPHLDPVVKIGKGAPEARMRQYAERHGISPDSSSLYSWTLADDRLAYDVEAKLHADPKLRRIDHGSSREIFSAADYQSYDDLVDAVEELVVEERRAHAIQLRATLRRAEELAARAPAQAPTPSPSRIIRRGRLGVMKLTYAVLALWSMFFYIMAGAGVAYVLHHADQRQFALFVVIYLALAIPAHLIARNLRRKYLP